MITKLKSTITAMFALAAIVAPFALAPAVSAQDANISGSLCQGADKLEFEESGTGGGDCSETEGSATELNDLIANIVNIFSVIVGIVAVIMIIIGGFRYITSGGDSGNVTGAKNTILYAIVGLVIVALAQFIVRFVLSQSTGLTS